MVGLGNLRRGVAVGQEDGREVGIGARQGEEEKVSGMEEAGIRIC